MRVLASYPPTGKDYIYGYIIRDIDIELWSKVKIRKVNIIFLGTDMILRIKAIDMHPGPRVRACLLYLSTLTPAFSLSHVLAVMPACLSSYFSTRSVGVFGKLSINSTNLGTAK